MYVPPLSKLIRFLLIAAGLIIVLSVIWNFIDSAYCGFLSDIADGVASGNVTVKEHDGTITFHRIFTWGYRDDWIDAAAIQFGLLLTIALVAATPNLTIKRRLIFTGIAVVITFVLQILAVIVMARTFNNIFFIIVSDVFPPLLWAVFALKYWFTPPKSPPPSEPGKQPRAQATK